MITAENLHFGFPAQAVFEGVSFRIPEQHAIVAVVGNSGIGKSTLLGLLAGFHSPSEGVVRVCGEPVGGPSPERPVVFQDHNLFPWKTVRGNIEFGLKARGMPVAERRRRSQALMEKMHLDDRAEAYPDELSGGMQQRVGLARCLAVEPRCILMDEPFSAIDFQTRGRIIDHFRTYLQQFGARAVLVTHDIREAVGMASCVVVIRGSQSIEVLPFDPPHTHAPLTDQALEDRESRVKQAFDGD